MGDRDLQYFFIFMSVIVVSAMATFSITGIKSTECKVAFAKHGYPYKLEEIKKVCDE